MCARTWESNAGFSISALTKTNMWLRTWCPLICTPLFFLLASSATWFATWSTIAMTCCPPLIVQIELAKDTCWNCPSDSVTHTSQRGSQRSNERGASSSVCNLAGE